MLLPKADLELPIFVDSLPDQEPAVDEVFDGALVAGLDAAQGLLDERDLVATEYADGVAQGVPEDEATIVPGGTDVVARGLPPADPASLTVGAPSALPALRSCGDCRRILKLPCMPRAIEPPRERASASFRRSNGSYSRRNF
jgi:hypothetical protein